MLLIGPPGSGKTDRILGDMTAAIRAGRSDQVLLLVPNSSMRYHILGTLAGDGLMVPDSVVATLAQFVRQRTPEMKEASSLVEDRILRDAVERAAAGEFGIRGQRGRVASLISELSNAGAGSLELEFGTRTGPQRAFVAVLREYEDLLSEAGFTPFNQRMALAGASIRGQGLGTVRKVYVHGFDRFNRQQEALLEALHEQAEEIVITLPEQPEKSPLATAGDLMLPRTISDPDVEILEAASPRSEVLEIARRILEGGPPFSDYSVVLRAPEAYLPVVREVFDALCIPYRAWDRRRLADQGPARHFAMWLRLVVRQFPSEETLEAVGSPLTPAGSRAQRDRFDFAARKALPISGLEALIRTSKRFREVRRFLASLRPLVKWRRRRLVARSWARECRKLIALFQSLPVPVDGESFRRTLEWRAAFQARKALGDALDEAAALPELGGGRRIPLGTFADAFEEVTRRKDLPDADRRVDVVNVLPIPESRLWPASVLFVCGLADGWFPRRFAEDGLFDDEDRRQLQSRGIQLRTSADHAEDERFLYRLATTSATRRLVLSFPLYDNLGKPLMRSQLLEAGSQPKRVPWSRLGDRSEPAQPLPVESLPADLRAAVAERNPGFSATGINDFRQCPQMYFHRKTLALDSRPPAPEERLDSRAVGSLVHKVLERWNCEPGPIGPLLDAEFHVTLKRLRLPSSLRTEQLRRTLRSDLERFAGDETAYLQASPDGQVFVEKILQYVVGSLEGHPAVKLRIDRYELDEEWGCFVTDYKYAGPQRVKELLNALRTRDDLQLPLYLAALEKELKCEPGGMALFGLKGATQREGMAVEGARGLQPVTKEEMRVLLDDAQAETAAAVGAILEGSVAVRPRDRDYCTRICEYGAVCRIRWPSTGRDDSDGGRQSCN